MRVLDSGDVHRLLDMESCIREVENAFRARGEGRRASSAVAGLELTGGGLHAKLGALDLSRSYAAVKINANFPDNPARFGLPTIQGIVVLFDASTGEPLACMDSGPITALRTAAASAVAARYLALPAASSIAFVGCGTQARAHAVALRHVRPIERIVAFDADRNAADHFAKELAIDGKVSVSVAGHLQQATVGAAIVVTSTPSRVPFLGVGSVSPGTFIAAVGADNEHKQEVSPALLRASAVVVDDLDQCSRIGDLHHAIEQGVMRREDIRASLDQVVAGRVLGRLSEMETIIFDSTGVAIEDVAAAAVVYERAEATRTATS